MFLSMDILRGDLASWDAKAYLGNADTAKDIRYVIPAGSLALDDASALYATTAEELFEAASRARSGMNLLCVGAPGKEALGICDMLNVLALDGQADDFDRAVKDCAKAIAWYADGFTQLAQAAHEGDEAALKRAATLLQYCLGRENEQPTDPSALAEQLDLLLHRNITSWQLLEDTIADWGWDLLDEYLCVTAFTPGRPCTMTLPAARAGTSTSTPMQVCLPQGEYMVVVVNLTQYGCDYREAAREIALQFRGHLDGVHVGASNPFSELQDLYYYGQQAKSAAEIGIMQGADEDVSFFHDRFLDFVAMRCLEACPPTTLFPPGYSRLRNYEHEHARSTSLVRFLHSYIEHDFQMKPTVAAEFCSRTTAFEKLRKIKQISGMDLDNPETRAALRIATRAIRLSKLAPSQPE